MSSDKDFRCWIHPMPEKASQGMWDWRVVVQRLSDGITRQQKVSGGWVVAESYARQLMDDMEASRAE